MTVKAGAAARAVAIVAVRAWLARTVTRPGPTPAKLARKRPAAPLARWGASRLTATLRPSRYTRTVTCWPAT